MTNVKHYPDPVEIETWEPVPDRPGFVRNTENRSIKAVYDDLVAYLTEIEALPEEYFTICFPYKGRRQAEPFPEFNRIACFPVRGGSEGYYVHVAAIRPNDDPISEGSIDTIYLGKTLYEGEEGLNRAAATAAACARALQA
jgi:hypothetical protein